jgi:hypothetical protein
LDALELKIMVLSFSVVYLSGKFHLSYVHCRVNHDQIIASITAILECAEMDDGIDSFKSHGDDMKVVSVWKCTQWKTRIKNYILLIGHYILERINNK